MKGYFWQVNFKPDIRWVRLTLPNGGYIKCVFEEDIASVIQNAMQHYVRVWGIAETDPTTEKILELEIKGVTILDDADSFEARESPFKDFDEASDFVINKNSELYRRLA